MFDHLAPTLFYVAIASSLSFGIINMWRAGFYDLRHARLKSEQAKHPHARHLRRRPLVSIVIFADNDETNIEACLKSVINSSYRKIEIIAIDNASRDKTNLKIRTFIKSHPKQTIKLHTKRKSVSRPQALATASKHAKGELIMVIDGSATLDNQGVRQAVMDFAGTSTNAALANTRITHNYRLMGVADIFRAAATIHAKKARAFIMPLLDSRNHAAIYTQEIFKQLVRPRHQECLDNINALRGFPSISLAYESSLIVSQSTRSTFRPHLGRNTEVRMSGLVKLGLGLVSLLEPIMLVIMLYAAFRFNSPGYVVLGWFSFTSLLLISIWSDESRTMSSKLSLSLMSVSAYGIYMLQVLLGYVRSLSGHLMFDRKALVK